MKVGRVILTVNAPLAPLLSFFSRNCGRRIQRLRLARPGQLLDELDPDDADLFCGVIGPPCEQQVVGQRYFIDPTGSAGFLVIAWLVRSARQGIEHSQEFCALAGRERGKAMHGLITERVAVG